MNICTSILLCYGFLISLIKKYRKPWKLHMDRGLAWLYKLTKSLFHFPKVSRRKICMVERNGILFYHYVLFIKFWLLTIPFYMLWLYNDCTKVSVNLSACKWYVYLLLGIYMYIYSDCFSCFGYWSIVFVKTYIYILLLCEIC